VSPEGSKEGGGGVGRAPGAVHSDPGAPLLTRLQDEAMALMETDDRELVDPDTALVELGMDSMAITQLKGVLANNYGAEVEDEVLFDEATTLRTLAGVVESGGEAGGGGGGGGGGGVAAVGEEGGAPDADVDARSDPGDEKASARQRLCMEQDGGASRNAGGGGFCPCFGGRRGRAESM
jgi:acyl carrier protein